MLFSMDIFEELTEMILSGKIRTRDELERAKSRIAGRQHLPKMPTNTDILAHIPEDRRREVVDLLRLKPVRTESGVAVVAVMTSPEPCPHGKCIYCPGGADTGTPQSYTGHEPAALRASMNEYDPYRQTFSRLEQLERNGHDTDKIDLIIMGGTFTARDTDYQRDFVKRCLEAMNKKESLDLKTAQMENEFSSRRCIGLTVETRPDNFGAGEIDMSLNLGTTRVELGVQTVNDDTLEKMNRGHGVDATIRSSALARDAGLKVGYHMMPGLPGETIQSDLASFDRIFHEADFKPDMLKIYPCLVVAGTELHEMYKRGEYEPYTTDDVVELLVDVKRMVPPWVRIQRIQRDIPLKMIEAGVDKSHVRQIVQWKLGEHGERCSCVRCREVGHRLRDKNAQFEPENVEMREVSYDAAGGKEYFISFEDFDNEVLIGYVRLRIPSENAHRTEMRNSAIIRELKVFGTVVPISKESGGDWQHRGYGKDLISRAQEISAEVHGAENLLVTSGIGAREYYRKLGFARFGPYMRLKL